MRIEMSKVSLNLSKIIWMTLSFLVAPLLSGIMIVLAFPNYHLYWMAWIAFVPLLLAIQGMKPWQALLVSWLSGVIFYFGMTPWINDFPSITTPARWIGYLYLGLYFGLFGFFLSIILNRTRLPLLIAAPIWVVFEYIRGNLFLLSFPCILLGHTQYLNVPIIQITSFAGVYGVSFVIMLTNGAATDLVIYWIGKRREKHGEKVIGGRLYGGLTVLLIVLLAWIWGRGVISGENTGRSIPIAVVQGNIPQEIKWNREYRERILSRYESLSEEAMRFGPRLIVWPEASTPGFVLKDLILLRRLSAMIQQLNTHLLVGSAEYPKFSTTPTSPIKLKRTGNTALFFSPQGKLIGRYLKVHLVPFGECLPYEGIIPWPDFIVPKKRTNFHNPGTEMTIFTIEEIRFGSLICWEIFFPDLTRSLVKKGAEFVVNISNEAWFGKSAVPNQVLAMSVFRAVENRVNVVRATNTGVSCFIDPFGRITGKVTQKGEDIFVTGTSTQIIFIRPPGTFYSRYGDVLAYGCITFLLGLVIWVSSKVRGRES